MNKSWHRPLLLLLLLVAFALRSWRLDYQELRGDEVFGYFFSLRTLPDIVVATVELHEPHPVASYYLQHFWLGWAGHSEFALRFTSLWFGVLAVALLYALGRGLLTPSAALLGTLLLGISPYALWHSQDARMYSMSLALTLASTLLMVRWLQRQRRRLALAYVAVTLLTLHTHYFAAFVLVAQNLFVTGRALLMPRLRLAWVNWLILQITVAFFYGPWLLRVQTILRDYDGNGDSPGFVAMLWRSLSVFAVGESTPLPQRPWWAWLAACLLLAGTAALWRRGADGRRSLALLGLYLGVPLLATWWSATQRPIFNERYLVGALPGFCLLVGAVVEWWGRFGAAAHRLKPVADRQNALKRIGAWVIAGRGQMAGLARVEWWGRAGAAAHRLKPVADRQNALKRIGAWGIVARGQVAGLVVVALLGILIGGELFALQRYYGDPAYSKTRGWRALAATLAQWSVEMPADQVRIAQNFPDPTLWYYDQGAVEHIVLPPGARDEVGAQAAVQALAVAGVKWVLLPRQPAPNWDDREIATHALATAYDQAVETQVGVWPLTLYSRPPQSLTPLAVTFQNGLALAGFAIQGEQLVPNGALVIYLAWQAAAATLTGSEKVFVQLLDSQGQLVAQQDQPLTINRTANGMPPPTVYGILLPESLSTGPYRLIAGLYDPAITGAPRLLTDTGADFIMLHEFE